MEPKSIRNLFHPFLSNEQAVLGLPMRLTVSLVIGCVALAAILSFIMNPCLFPSKMIINIEPMVDSVNASDDFSIFNITVQTLEGYPIVGANVIIKGLRGIGYNSTDVNGYTQINVSEISLETGANEGYLDVQVKAPCQETFDQDDMLKIIRR